MSKLPSKHTPKWRAPHEQNPCGGAGNARPLLGEWPSVLASWCARRSSQGRITRPSNVQRMTMGSSHLPSVHTRGLQQSASVEH